MTCLVQKHNTELCFHLNHETAKPQLSELFTLLHIGLFRSQLDNMRKITRQT